MRGHVNCLPRFTVPDESLFEEDVARLCMMCECESGSSVWPSRLNRSALFPRPRCVLPPSDGQLARGSNVSTDSGPPCHMSDRKSLQENTLFMVYVSVISQPKSCQRPCNRLQGFHIEPRSVISSTVSRNAFEFTPACLCTSFAGLSQCMRCRMAAFVKVCNFSERMYRAYRPCKEITWLYGTSQMLHDSRDVQKELLESLKR